jgi:hypothetical protein
MHQSATLQEGTLLNIALVPASRDDGIRALGSGWTQKNALHGTRVPCRAK